MKLLQYISEQERYEAVDALLYDYRIIPTKITVKTLQKPKYTKSDFIKLLIKYKSANK